MREMPLVPHVQPSLSDPKAKGLRQLAASRHPSEARVQYTPQAGSLVALIVERSSGLPVIASATSGPTDSSWRWLLATIAVVGSGVAHWKSQSPGRVGRSVRACRQQDSQCCSSAPLARSPANTPVEATGLRASNGQWAALVASSLSGKPGGAASA